jgi:CubicO group peptidase (beta-lactamase class C family)
VLSFISVKQSFFLCVFFCFLWGLNSCETAVEKRNRLYDRISRHEIKLIPDFRVPTKKELKEKKKYASQFYKNILGSEVFNGQFLVAKNGKVFFYKAQGYSNFREKKMIDAHTPLHVASVSKVATALCVLRLVDKKLIRLDADVRRYLPEIPYKGITVRMLLNHRSGIPYYGYFTYGNWKLSNKLHNHDVLNLLKEHKFPLNFRSDAKFAYCNTNFSLLALIIEKVTSKSFPAAMRKYIFEPLHMEDSFILSDEMNELEISQSYNSSMVPQAFDYLDAVYGDKNLYTTAHDLLKMDMATYSNDFLSDSLRKQMYKGYSYEHQGVNNYGLGIRMKEMTGRSSFFFHTGWWHGNTTCYGSLRKDTICVVALSNKYTRSVYNIGLLVDKYGNYPYDYKEDLLKQNYK